MYCKGASAASWQWRLQQAQDNASAARQCQRSNASQFFSFIEFEKLPRSSCCARRPPAAAAGARACGPRCWRSRSSCAARQHAAGWRCPAAGWQRVAPGREQLPKPAREQVAIGSEQLPKPSGKITWQPQCQHALLPAHRRPEVHKAVVADLHAAGAWPLLLAIAASLLSLLRALRGVLLPPRPCIKPLVEPVVLEKSRARVGRVAGELRRQVPVLQGAAAAGECRVGRA